MNIAVIKHENGVEELIKIEGQEEIHEDELTRATALLQNLSQICEGAQIHYPSAVDNPEILQETTNSDGNLQIITQGPEHTSDSAFTYVIQSEYINEHGETTIEYRLADQLVEGQHYVVEEYATQYEEDSQGNVFETVYVHQEGADMQNSVEVVEDGHTLAIEELNHQQNDDSYEEEDEMTIVEEENELEQQKTVQVEEPIKMHPNPEDDAYFKQETSDSFAIEQETSQMVTINDPLAIKQETDQHYTDDQTTIDHTIINVPSNVSDSITNSMDIAESKAHPKATETVVLRKDTKYVAHYRINEYAVPSKMGSGARLAQEEREQLAQNKLLDREALIVDRELEDEEERQREEDLMLARIKEKKRKEQSKKETKTYACLMCLQEFKSAAGAKMHMAVKHANKDQIKTESEEDEDETNVDVLNFETCFCCGEPSDSAHTIGDFKCDHCEKLFVYKVSLKRHCSIEHPVDDTFNCSECSKVFDAKQDLIEHMRVHVVNPVRCDDCGRQFSRKFHLTRHINQSDCMGGPKPVFQCRVCSRTFTRKDNLGEHLKAHLGTGKRKKSHACEHCERTFTSKNMLVIHYRTHTGEKPYACEVCEKKFPSSGALKKHRRMHTGEKPYVCSKCDKSFAAKETFNRHWKTHTGLKPHTCQFCGKSFIQATQLRAHIFHHTGENAFTCPYCGRAFNRKLRLTTHIKFLHEGAEPLKCPNLGCDKTFFRREDMVRHSVVHTGEKPHSCESCGKNFSTKSSLKTHMYTHQAEKPVSCESCKRAFKRQDCLIRHMRAKHRDVLEDIVASAEKRRIKKRLMEIASQYNTKESLNNNLVWNEFTLTESVKELLTLLVDGDCLKDFGHPDAPVDKVLSAVIKRCGHEPASEEKFDYIDRMRENAKMLFTVVIDDSAMKDLLSNQTVDEVILHVIKLARKNNNEDLSKDDILDTLNQNSHQLQEIKEALDSESEDNPDYLDDNHELSDTEFDNSKTNINSPNPQKIHPEEPPNAIDYLTYPSERQSEADFDGDDISMEEERLYDETNGEMYVYEELGEDIEMEFTEEARLDEEYVEYNKENLEFNEEKEEIVDFNEENGERIVEYINEDVYNEDETTQENIIIQVVNETTES